MTFEIEKNNEWHDITPFLTKFSPIEREQIEIISENATRTMDGTAYKGRIAVKLRLKCIFRGLTTAECHELFDLIAPEYVNVRWSDPFFGMMVLSMQTPESIPATFVTVASDGTEFWNGIELVFEER